MLRTEVGVLSSSEQVSTSIIAATHFFELLCTHVLAPANIGLRILDSAAQQQRYVRALANMNGIQRTLVCCCWLRLGCLNVASNYLEKSRDVLTKSNPTNGNIDEVLTVLTQPPES